MNLRPWSVFYFCVHHGGIRALRVYPAAGQHKRMVYGVFAYPFFLFVRVCDINFIGRGEKGRLRKRLRGARTYEVKFQ